MASAAILGRWSLSSYLGSRKPRRDVSPYHGCAYNRRLACEYLEDRRLLAIGVGDLVWKDVDSDGIEDPGEPGIAGAVVEIFSSPDGAIGNADDVSGGVAITNATGHYILDNLTAGTNYYLVFRTPVGYTFTTQNAGSDDTEDSDANATGVTAMFTLNPGQNRTDLDAGLVGAAPGFGFALRAGSPPAATSDEGRSVATDASGNVYVAGDYSGTVDFDSGPGVYNLSSAGGSSDVFIAKYSSTGALVWARSVGATVNEDPRGIAVAADGSVYVTGRFYTTVDFDPGPGTYDLTSVGWEVFVLKLDFAGNFVWARSWGGAGLDYSFAVTVGGDGSVYTAGSFQGTADFDPGPGTVNLTSAGLTDMFVSKLDSAGNLVWARAMGGTGSESAYGVVVAGDGSVSTTGTFENTVDFDPGAGSYSLTSAGATDIFVSKLDSAGNFVWARGMGGTSGDVAFDIAVAADGSVHTTGYFQSTVDFDPGPGTFNLTSTGSYDVFVSKLDSAGNFVWARGLTGNIGYGIAVGADGSVYTTGGFAGTADLDPGPGTFNLTSAGSSEVFVSKLDSAGKFLWAGRMGGTNGDLGYEIALTTDGNVYTTGCFFGTADFDPGAGTFNLVDAGSGDFFLAKIQANHAPALDNSGDMTLNPIEEDDTSNNGTLVSDIIASDEPPDRITDPDPGALEGIALIDADTSNGAWEYSLDSGANWNAIGTVNENSALLLASDANTLVRFVPTLDFNGTVDPGITFRAWDQTLGTNGGTVDTSINGDPTAFSSATESAYITVTAVNDAPTLNAIPDAATIDEDAGEQTVNLGEIGPGGGADEAGQVLAVTATSSHPGLIPNPTVSYTSPNATGSLSYTPVADANGTAVITVTVTDNGGTANGGVNTFSRTFSVTVNAVNDAPEIVVPGPQTVNQNTDLAIAGIVVSDVDASTGQMTLAAEHGILTLSGISGLSFTTGADGTSGMTFSGTLADINAALDNLVYRGNARFAAADTITLIANDQGNTGSGGEKSTTRTIAVNVLDTEAPAVSLTVNGVTESHVSDTAPSVTIGATDNNAPPDGTAVTVDVDLDNDGDFLDTGESNYTAATLTGGSATFDVRPALPEGPHGFRARVSDAAGNQGTSAVSHVTVIITPTFSNLAAPTIVYGTGSTSVSGTITAGPFVPTGSVSIVLDGVTHSASINQATGDFSSNFDTGSLHVSRSPYTITYCYPGDTTFNPIADTPRTLTLTPASLTVTADDKTKTYGQSNPAFTASYNGFVGTDGPLDLSGPLVLSTTAGQFSHVGDYPITPSGLSSNDYTITFRDGTLTITPAALTITASDRSKDFGEVVTFAGSEFTTAGLLNGDTVTSVSLTSDGTVVDAPVGKYNIVPSGAVGSGLTNYNASYANGTLTVDPVVRVAGQRSDNKLTLRRNGDKIELIRVRAGKKPQVLWQGVAEKLTVYGATKHANAMTVDFAFGGLFNFPRGLVFDSDSVNQKKTDSLLIRGTAAKDTTTKGADIFAIRTNQVLANGFDIQLRGIERVTVDGGAGDDTYQVFDLGPKVTLIDRKGTDVLDFSQAAVGVTVDLNKRGGQSQKVFAPRNHALALKATIENVIGTPYDDKITGNSTHNVIDGRGGDDTIDGGSGRDLLIGGKGRDTLRGGSGEDILIGGTTVYDNNDAAFAAIMAEWTSRLKFKNRCDRLDSGIPDSTLGLIRLKRGDTVLDDLSGDTLYGGPASDWFLDFPDDIVRDRGRGDR